MNNKSKHVNSNFQVGNRVSCLQEKYKPRLETPPQMAVVEVAVVSRRWQCQAPYGSSRTSGANNVSSSLASLAGTQR